MRYKMFKISLKILGCLLACYLLKKFCYSKTDGFALYKICSSLRYCPEWEAASPTFDDSEEIAAILEQPFYYFAKGAQSYVFVSKDGKTVIKFFRIYHLQPPLLLKAVALPLPLQSYQIQKMINKRQELDKDFQSY